MRFGFARKSFRGKIGAGEESCYTDIDAKSQIPLLARTLTTIAIHKSDE